ncbi:MAG: LPS export ABC transporter periplasmic protein LptC [Symploca sp. SIO2G7]|nr:LPS export ABC transporter periplasmic protein LptC [Symploca sp. SIO2G7]
MIMNAISKVAATEAATPKQAHRVRPDRRFWLLAATTVILVLLSQWWLDRDPRSTTPISSFSDTPVDYALTDFSAEFYNANGELDLVVGSPRLEHRADTRQARVERPEFSLTQHAPAWNGRADSARIDRNLEQLELTGNVEIFSEHHEGEIRLESALLLYDRQLETLRSPGPARLSQPGTELKGDTLTLWLQPQRAELNQNVQGTYRRIAKP